MRVAKGCMMMGSIGLGTSRKSDSTIPMRTASGRREVSSSAGREADKAPRVAAIAHIPTAAALLWVMSLAPWFVGGAWTEGCGGIPYPYPGNDFQYEFSKTRAA